MQTYSKGPHQNDECTARIFRKLTCFDGLVLLESIYIFKSSKVTFIQYKKVAKYYPYFIR